MAFVCFGEAVLIYEFEDLSQALGCCGLRYEWTSGQRRRGASHAAASLHLS